MPLLGTYTFAGAASLASGTNCIAHSLPTTPDWAIPGIPIAPAGAASALSIPVNLASRQAVAVICTNPNNTGVNAEMVAVFVHSIGR